MTRAGRAWELQLARWHDEYARDRLALVFQCHPPVRVIGDAIGGTFRAAWKGTGPPDFVGVLAAGRAVVFDAKHVAGDRLPFSNIADHQARDLTAAHDRGAYAFLAVEASSGRWVLPWDTIASQWWGWRRSPGRTRAASTAMITAYPMDADGWLAPVNAARAF